MNKDTFVNNLRIKDTILDRRYKLTSNQSKEILDKHKKGKTISELAKEYEISYAGIKSIIDPIYRFKKAASRRARYYNMPIDERTRKTREYQKSTRDYKARLYEAFTESK